MKKLLNKLEDYSLWRGFVLVFVLFFMVLCFMFIAGLLISLWNNEILIYLEGFEKRLFAIWKKMLALYIVTSLVFSLFITSNN